VPKPLIVVPLSEATMIAGEEAFTQNVFVVSQAAAPVAPVPAVAPFWSKKMLAARALGGLLILIPSPLLDVARWHELRLDGRHGHRGHRHQPDHRRHRARRLLPC
jgi:hypothetical protein